MKLGPRSTSIFFGCACVAVGCDDPGSSTGGTAGDPGSGGQKATGGTAGGGGRQVGGGPAAAGATDRGGSSPVGAGGQAGLGAGGGGGPIAGAGSSGAATMAGSGGLPATGGASTGGVSAGGMAGSGGVSTGGADTAGGAGAGASAGGSGTAGAPGGVVVALASAKQTIDGFGINDTWGSSFSSSVADELFTTTGKGIGLSILRVGMNDGGTFYNSFESTNISAAKTRGALIIGSCWSPPANCKSNSSVNNGGHLNTSCYDSWATTITNFAKTNQLYAMSIANEPDFASCGTTEPCNGNYPTTLYTANEMVAFVKVAGPKLKAAGVKLIAPEASEWLHFWSNESATGSQPSNKNSSDPLKCGFPATNTACASGGGYDYGHYLAKDAAAWDAIDIIGVHEYDTQHAEPWPTDVTAARKPIWQTEMSGVKWWPEQGPSSDIANGVAIAGWIHSALVVGDASAWLWWWYSQTSDNEGLMLGSTDTKRHYTFGNYSKFVRPGYVRVDVTGNASADLLLSAYKGTDGTVVVVAINKGSASATVPMSISGGTAPASCTPNVTSATDDLVAKTAVPVSNGSFSATLASATVTTFVCK